MEKPFEGELIIKEDECNSCRACIEVCPCNALTFPKSEGQGKKGPRLAVNPEVCILCGACVNACPANVLEVKRSKIDIVGSKIPSWENALKRLVN